MNGGLIALLTGATLGLSAAASPGPFQAFMITQTLLGGWRKGAAVALAVLASDPPIVITVLLLLNQLPNGLIHAIGLAGGLFALYLAWGSWRATRTVPPVPATEAPTSPVADRPDGFWSTLGRGALINLLSPGPYLFWTLVLGPTFLQAWERTPGQGLSFLGGFYLLFIGGMLGIVSLFHQARRLGKPAVRRLAQLSALVLAGFGFWLLVQHGPPLLTFFQELRLVRAFVVLRSFTLLLIEV